MRKIKKITIMVLTSIFILFAFTACSGSDPTNSTELPLENLVATVQTNNSIVTLEDQICATIEVVEKATLCVYNYQTIKVRTGFGGATTTSEQLYGTGSGVIYYKGLNDNGTYTYRLITNEHVVTAVSTSTATIIQGGERYEIYDGTKTIQATLLGAIEESDIAILEFTTSSEYLAVQFAKQENIKVGRFVVAIGTPLDIEFYNTVTFGIISKVQPTYLQHDAAINSGNSGGPLFDIYGNLIGINNAKLVSDSSTEVEGMMFAIAIDVVADAITSITRLSNYVIKS